MSAQRPELPPCHYYNNSATWELHIPIFHANEAAMLQAIYIPK